jgi:S1-C subfamily serine protease
MPDSENREFIREQIMDKAAGRRYRMRKMGLRILEAISFGLIAAVSFTLFMKFVGGKYLPQTSQELPSTTVVIDRDTDEEETQEEEEGEELPQSTWESAEEETRQEESQTTEEALPEEDISQEEQWERQMEEIADAAVAAQLKEQDSYLARGWYRLVAATVPVIQKGLVTINGTSRETDGFLHSIEEYNPCCGAIICMTDAEVLILADYDSIAQAEAMTVTFDDGTTVDGRIKKTDQTTGIAIVSVSKVTLSETTLNRISTLTLGNSYVLSAGTPLIAAGSPIGYTGSVLEGMVSLVQKNTIGTDTSFQLIYTDMPVAENGEGFLFNTAGELVGILTDRYGDRDTGLPAAIGISTLKGIMEALSSGIDVAYLGIQGQNATASVAAAYDMPIGIYITKVITDSPAYVAGLKAGDILVSCDSTELTTMQKLQSFLESYSTGDVVVLQVYRAGQEEYIKMDFSVTLGSR